jgi:hypothetical protein
MDDKTKFAKLNAEPAFDRTVTAELHTITGKYYPEGLPANETQHSQGWFDMSERELESIEREQNLQDVDTFNYALFEAAKKTMLCDTTTDYFEWILRRFHRDLHCNPQLAKRMFEIMPLTEQAEFFEHASSELRPDQIFCLINGI